MSQIANLVLIENGESQVYYDHWAAYDIDRYLLWGAERMIDFIRAHKTATHYDWSPYAEAGALVDLDNQVLLFYGGALYFDPSLFPLYEQLIRLAWRDYEVKFAYNGLIDLFDYLGIEDDRFRQKLSYPALSDDAIAFYFQDYDAIDNNFYTGLLSIQQKKGLTLIPLHMPFMDDTEFLFAGNNFIDYAAKFEGKSVETIRSLFERDQSPEFGLHADYETKKLYYWQNGMGFLGDIDLTVLTERWPGWKLVSLYRHPDRHLALINQHDLFPSQSQERQLATIKEALIAHYPDKKEYLDNMVAELGDDILLHPDVERFVAFTISPHAQKEQWQALIELL